MRRFNLITTIVIFLLCGAMPTKALAQSAPVSTDEDDKKRLSYILSINPVDQHLSQSQYDDYDCFIASMFMALDFFGEEITYNELVPIVRGNDKNGLSADSILYLTSQKAGFWRRENTPPNLPVLLRRN